MKKLIYPLLIILFLNNLNAQSLKPEVISTAGDFFVGANAMLSWTIGETMITTLEGTNAILTQGFQQPFEMVVSNISDHHPPLQIKVFPNPISTFLSISFLIERERKFIIDIVDITGKMIYNEKVTSSQLVKQIDFSLFKTGLYILRLRSEEGYIIKSYKIQKITK